MTYRYSSIAMIMLLLSTSSYAASAVLPPLPSGQPSATLQESTKPSLAAPSSSVESDSTNALKAEQNNPAPSSSSEVLPQVTLQNTAQAPVDQKNVTSSNAPNQATIMPAPDANQASAVNTSASADTTNAPAASVKEVKKASASSQDEKESFIDTGQKKLPRLQKSEKNADSDGYNPSELRIPAIESAEKNAVQSNAQTLDNSEATAAAPSAVETPPTVHAGPDVTLPETAHVNQNADKATLSTTTDPKTSQPQTASSEFTSIAPVVTIQSPLETSPIVSNEPIQPAPEKVFPAASTAKENESTEVQPPSQASPQPSASSVSDAVPVIAPASIPVILPPPPPPPPPVPADEAHRPQAAAASAIIDTSSAEHVSVTSSVEPVAHSASTVETPSILTNEVPRGNGKVPLELTLDQIKFIRDEAIVFTLGDDDVELGQLTEMAKISQMPAYDYIKLFWKSYKTPRDKMHKRDVDIFLAMLETYPAAAYEGAMNSEEASNQAFDAASSGKLSELRAIISYYPVLQMRDMRGNNMLSSAIESDHLEVAKFLLARGIDLYATNYEGYDAFAIARDDNNDEASSLLTKAKFLGRK